MQTKDTRAPCTHVLCTIHPRTMYAPSLFCPPCTPQARLAQCDAHLNGIKAQEAQAHAVLDELRSAQAETELDMPALNVEKKEVRCAKILVSVFVSGLKDHVPWASVELTSADCALLTRALLWGRSGRSR